MSRQKIMMEIDREIATVVLSLADYATGHYAKKRIVEKAFAILLIALLTDDGFDSLDAFERVQQDMDLANESERSLMYGEFLTIVTCFVRRYKHYKYLLKDLEHILPSDCRELPEEIYSVEWSKHGDVLMVS